MSNIYANNINPRSGDTVTFPQNIKVLGTATYEDVANVDSVGIITARSGIDVTGAISLDSVAIPSAGTARIFSRDTDSALYLQTASGNRISFLDGSQNSMSSFEPTVIKFFINNTPKLIITSAGLVGIGTDNINAQLQVNNGLFGLEFNPNSENAVVSYNRTTSAYAPVGLQGSTVSLKIGGSGGTALLVDASQNVSVSNNLIVQGTVSESIGGGPNAIQANNGISVLRRTNDAYGPYINLSKSRNTTAGQSTIVQNGDTVGSIGYCADDGVDMNSPIAYINGVVDGTPAENSIPGSISFQTITTGTATKERLKIRSNGDVILGPYDPPGSYTSTAANIPYEIKVAPYGWAYGSEIASISMGNHSGSVGNDDGQIVFKTAANVHSASSSQLVEAMRIDSGGNVFITKTADVFNTAGIRFPAYGAGEFTRNQGALLALNRLTTDGDLIDFYRDGASQGNIRVDSGTVSLTGAHLSRWSQLPGGADRTEILRGSILSNLDEMCEWGEEDNEQLNRMKVSDVVGDKNVAGVFQSWDDEDDTYLNDFYCAMTGDFVIRIAQGVTVERGDLLMSAGDGTAKPQDDDIVRSKTIAKVTSNTVSVTHSDGSYCVPCVLMAC